MIDRDGGDEHIFDVYRHWADQETRRPSPGGWNYIVTHPDHIDDGHTWPSGFGMNTDRIDGQAAYRTNPRIIIDDTKFGDAHGHDPSVTNSFTVQTQSHSTDKVPGLRHDDVVGAAQAVREMKETPREGHATFYGNLLASVLGRHRSSRPSVKHEEVATFAADGTTRFRTGARVYGTPTDLAATTDMLAYLRQRPVATSDHDKAVLAERTEQSENIRFMQRIARSVGDTTLSSAYFRMPGSVIDVGLASDDRPEER